ncbi:MAG: hypothetical protein GC159_05030 [Phycisphaera sp.]|nr:hypothetical protein [Phycisphaera sp.]
MNVAEASFKSRRYVDRDQFVELLLCNKHIVRCDEPGGEVRGLLDTETGQRYLISQNDLERVEARN